ncbi:MAG: hypothetical protein OXK80_06470 [Bdellovibrionales bacterium]|nr:hypothetical protein [Bdellovibrionales bacterium]
MTFIKLVFILIGSLFIFLHCTDDIQREPDKERMEDRDENFEVAERGSRSTNRRRSSRSSRRSSSSSVYNPYRPYIDRNPINEDTEKPAQPREKGGVCIGNLLWLRESCDRLPEWLDRAESNGFEKVEIKSNGDVVWHWGGFVGTWEEGLWKSGAFYEGTWIDGTWEGGFWKHGTWLNGIWKSGSWESGEFLGGTWKNGNWCTGTWSGGTWEKGLWTSGVFESGIWKHGTWSYGEWRADNESWEGGSCYSTNQNGRSEKHTTNESPAHTNSPCRNQTYEDFHNKNLQCDEM